MHAPIELGPRLYGVLSVATGADRFDEADLELLVAAGALLGGRDRQRDRLPARAPHRALADARLRAGVAAGSCRGYETGLLYAPAARRADRRRPLRGLAAAERGGRRAGGRRRGQGRRDRRAERDGPLLRRGAQLGRGVAGARCSTQTNAMLHGPAAERHLRDRVPRRADAGGRCAGRAPATCRRCTCPAARAARARGDRAAARGGRGRRATASASSSSPTATWSSPTPTGWSRRAAAARPTAPSASRSSWSALAADARRTRSSCTRAVHERGRRLVPAALAATTLVALGAAPPPRRALRLNGRVTESAYARAGVDQTRVRRPRCARSSRCSPTIATGRPAARRSAPGHYANVLRLDDDRGLALSTRRRGHRR